MGAIEDISSMQDFARIIHVRQSALIEIDDEVVNDELKEDEVNREYYA